MFLPEQLNIILIRMMLILRPLVDPCRRCRRMPQTTHPVWRSRLHADQVSGPYRNILVHLIINHMNTDNIFVKVIYISCTIYIYTRVSRGKSTQSTLLGHGFLPDADVPVVRSTITERHALYHTRGRGQVNRDQCEHRSQR